MSFNSNSNSNNNNNTNRNTNPYSYAQFASESIQLMQNMMLFMDNINRNFERFGTSSATRTGRTRPVRNLYRPTSLWNFNSTNIGASAGHGAGSAVPPPVQQHRAPGFGRTIPMQNLRSFWDPIEVGITDEERRQVVELLHYDSSNNELPPSCPISMANFQPGQSIHRIRGCGHVFTPYHLQRWFRNHTTCPVCRYDVRQSLPNNTRQEASLSATSGVDDQVQGQPQAQGNAPEQTQTHTQTNPNPNVAYIQAEFDMFPLTNTLNTTFTSNLTSDPQLSESLINLISNSLFPINSTSTAQAQAQAEAEAEAESDLDDDMPEVD